MANQSFKNPAPKKQVKRKYTNPPGRPPKYDKAWGDEQAKTLADKFKNGESLEEVYVELGICEKTFKKVVDRSPAFKTALEQGLLRSKATWLRNGRLGAFGEADVNAQVYRLNMANRFGWSERTDQNIHGNLTVNFNIDYSDEIAEEFEQ